MCLPSWSSSPGNSSSSGLRKWHICLPQSRHRLTPRRGGLDSASHLCKVVIKRLKQCMICLKKFTHKFGLDYREQVFSNDWLRDAVNENRLPYAGTVSYQGDNYLIYVPTINYKKGIGLNANNELSNATFSLSGYSQNGRIEETFSFLNIVGFLAGSSPSIEESKVQSMIQFSDCLAA